LGADAEDLPGFVVLLSAGKGGQMQPIASRQWSAGILPSKFQGVKLNSIGDPVLYIENPPGVSSAIQRDSIDAINALNRIENTALQDPEIMTRVAQYEMAFKMQSSVPGLVDMSKEPKEVMEMYGAKPGDGSFASNCLLARRLAERGVRFIQLYHRDWDHHGGLKQGIAYKAEEVDRPTAALIKDLKQRGMLDDTLVVWGGEFGRTPMCEIRNPRDAKNAGRDHHPLAYSLFLAGGGIKGGQVIGKTDDLCMNIVEDKVHVHDLQATMLQCLGLDHTRLTFHHMGRDFRLTDVEGNVVKKMLV
jgi:hypothetical protein